MSLAKVLLIFLLMLSVVIFVVFYGYAHIKGEVFKYERIQGREPKVVEKLNTWDFVMKSGDRTVYTVIHSDWDSEMPGISIKDYDDSTYVYWIGYATMFIYPVKVIIIGSPELIKKYDGNLPSPVKLERQGEVKSELFMGTPTLKEVLTTMNVITAALTILIFYISFKTKVLKV